jgi:hypothetical protein
MSSFQLNLSSLTIGAKERLARLEASGGALRARLLSSPPADEASAPRGVVTRSSLALPSVAFAPGVGSGGPVG